MMIRRKQINDTAGQLVVLSFNYGC